MEKKDESDHESGKNWSKLLVTPIISVLCRNPPVSDRREDGGLRLSQLGCMLFYTRRTVGVGLDRHLVVTQTISDKVAIM